MKILQEWKNALKVPLKFNFSILFLIGLLIYSFGITNGLLYSFILIGSILFHEYSHIWIAQRCGAEARYVTVMMFDAAAMMDPPPLLIILNES